MAEPEPIVWNPCADCTTALRFVLEQHGPQKMGLMVGPIIRMCMECSKILPKQDGELKTKLKLNLPE